MIDECSFSADGLPFHFLNDVFGSLKVVNFDTLFFMNHTFGVISVKYLPNLRVPCIFLSKTFMVLLLFLGL
jgi:hypothetical protein